MEGTAQESKYSRYYKKLKSTPEGQEKIKEYNRNYYERNKERRQEAARVYQAAKYEELKKTKTTTQSN